MNKEFIRPASKSLRDKAYRVALAATFRQAKRRLRTADEVDSVGFKDTFICCALEGQGPLADVATEIVQSRINYLYVLDEWVLNNVPDVKYSWLRTAEGRQAMQDYRHRWLDVLIEEFSV